MARRTATNRWFVSVEAPKQLLLKSPQKPLRETKTFSTEAEANATAVARPAPAVRSIPPPTGLASHAERAPSMIQSEIFRRLVASMRKY
jgi:hypothetical protein